MCVTVSVYITVTFSFLDSTRKCVCQNVTECPKDSAPLCLNSGVGSVATTVTECEVGARRCAGEQVNVISIEACSE